jgi:hypothetical protein
MPSLEMLHQVKSHLMCLVEHQLKAHPLLALGLLTRVMHWLAPKA